MNDLFILVVAFVLKQGLNGNINFESLCLLMSCRLLGI